jgi:hypothetical protein
MEKLAIRKFEGDDKYSWAVFKAADVQGLRNPVFHWQATPIVTGLDRGAAASTRDWLQRKET